RDLLSSKEKGLWGESVGASRQLKDGKLLLERTVVHNRRVTGVVSCLPTKAEPWRDLVIDLEFTILAGRFDLGLCYGPDIKYYLIRFDAQNGYELEKPYRMTLGIKGSSVSLKQPDTPLNADT